MNLMFTVYYVVECGDKLLTLYTNKFQFEVSSSKQTSVLKGFSVSEDTLPSYYQNVWEKLIISA